MHNLIFCRHTKPLPEEIFLHVEDELFNGELTDEEIEEKQLYVPRTSSLYEFMIFLGQPKRRSSGGMVRGA